MALVLGEALEELGQAGARHLVPDRDPVGLEPGVVPLPEGRRGAEGEEVGEHVAHLADEVVALLVVAEPDVHVHAADEEAPGDLLELHGEGVVAFLPGAADLPSLGERVGGGGDDLEAVLPDRLRYGPAKTGKVGAHLLHGLADHRADLDLALHELGGDLLPEALAARLDHLRRGLVDEVPGLTIDD